MPRKGTKTPIAQRILVLWNGINLCPVRGRKHNWTNSSYAEYSKNQPLPRKGTKTLEVVTTIPNSPRNQPMPRKGTKTVDDSN